MRTQSIYLAIVFILLCPYSSAQWIQTPGPYGAVVTSLAVSGINVVAGTYHEVFLSSDNGSNWTRCDLSLPSVLVYSLAFGDSCFFAGTYGAGAFLSTDYGKTWRQKGIAGNSILSIAFSGTNVFVGTWSGGVLLSTNRGTNWTAVNSGLTNETVASLAVCDSILFAGTYGIGVFLSTNNGASWTQTALTSRYVWCLAEPGTSVVAGTDGGVFLSTDKGTSWVQEGLASEGVTSLTVSGGNLIAGTLRAGAHALVIAVTGAPFAR